MQVELAGVMMALMSLPVGEAVVGGAMAGSGTSVAQYCAVLKHQGSMQSVVRHYAVCEASSKVLLATSSVSKECRVGLACALSPHKDGLLLLNPCGRAEQWSFLRNTCMPYWRLLSSTQLRFFDPECKPLVSIEVLCSL